MNFFYLGRHVVNVQRLCRIRLEIAQLQHIRRMWEKLQWRIRHVYLTLFIKGYFTFNANPESTLFFISIFVPLAIIVFCR